MSEADERLAALLRHDDPPAHDPMFRVKVLERAARRRLQLRMAAVAGLGVAAMGLVALAAPSLSAVVESSTALPTLCIALAVLSSGWGMTYLRRPV